MGSLASVVVAWVTPNLSALVPQSSPMACKRSFAPLVRMSMVACPTAGTWRPSFAYKLPLKRLGVLLLALITTSLSGTPIVIRVTVLQVDPIHELSSFVDLPTPRGQVGIHLALRLVDAHVAAHTWIAEPLDIPIAGNPVAHWVAADRYREYPRRETRGFAIGTGLQQGGLHKPVETHISRLFVLELVPPPNRGTDQVFLRDSIIALRRLSEVPKPRWRTRSREILCADVFILKVLRPM